ncbi:MAG TPA: fatty acid--CoA ligase [Steroidobacteraceae bacterium]|nr:fatty acid--CoA ligase [Steroidobacteraceae bacterium]
MIASADSIGTLGELSAHHAQTRGARRAFVYEGRVTTYAEFDRNANQVAHGLIREGLTRAARVAYLGKNSDRFFELVFGCAKSATVLVGINWRLSVAEIAFILNDSGAQILFVGTEFADLASAVKEQVPRLRRIICMGDGQPWESFARWREQGASDAPDVAVSESDAAIQMYTSGTTGQPKGVQLAHRSFFVMMRYPRNADMQFDEWSEDDVNLVAMPSFHIGGVGWGIAGMRPGACNVVLREFDPGAVLRMIGQYGITKLFLVPTAMRMVIQQPESRQTDYSSLKFITYAASPIPLDLLREAIDVFGCGFVQLYGMTETTGGATYLPPQDHDVNGNERMRSAGKAFPGVSLKVVDREGREVAARVLGEICIRSPANMIGYWNLPEETCRTLVDGYVHSGDIGYLDEDGYVYVVDRAKDLIISGAENVCPADVETAMQSHPAVADVAVIGVPDARWGEAVKAIVVLRAGAKATAQELIAHCRSRIAGFKLPKSVDFVPDLPRNASGKVLKRELRKRYAS